MNESESDRVTAKRSERLRLEREREEEEKDIDTKTQRQSHTQSQRERASCTRMCYFILWVGPAAGILLRIPTGKRDSIRVNINIYILAE